jgi:beta-N-acetylhexosaminidase
VRLSSDPVARRRLVALGGGALAALIVGLVAGSGGGGEDTGRSTPREIALRELDRLSLRQQVGQLTVSAFADKRPPAYIRRRLRARETAGVILFGGNAGTPAQWRRLTRALQRNAHGEAFVMVDQEGGDVRTVGWAGPQESQPFQGPAGEVTLGAQEAARQLHGIGVNVNLAPVADLAVTPVMAPRAFAGDVADKTASAIAGMASGRVAATAKHFPGLGAATVNTDDGSATSRADLAPFRAAIGVDVPLMMVSHALYPTLDKKRIASQSRPIVTGLLRERLHYDGVVVTDSIEAQAVLDRSGVATAAVRSISAGADLILTTGSASWNAIYPRLLEKARGSRSFRARVRASAARVLELKRWLGLR